jgi:hypothetical protein
MTQYTDSQENTYKNQFLTEICAMRLLPARDFNLYLLITIQTTYLGLKLIC